MSHLELDPTALSAIVLLAISTVMRFWRKRYPRGYFVAQVAVFSALTWLLRADGIIPYSVTSQAAPLPQRVLVAGLEIAWWLVGAWLTRGFLRAFVLLGRKEREAILIQELLGAVVYMTAIVAIFTYVLDLPVKGLLATSGALAIIIGLALQSSLGDAFSGIVMNLERPYRVGDWISVDSTVQGHVIETNWRATHIRTSSNDMAIVPNSIIAKSKIVNFSEPGQLHNAGVAVRLNRRLSPDVGALLLRDVLLGSAKEGGIVDPSVTVADITAEAIEFQLGFSVPDITSVDSIKSEVLRRSYYALSVAGGGFAPAKPTDREYGATAERACLLEAIPLFSTLTTEERTDLLEGRTRRVYEAGAIVAKRGAVMQSLVIISRGVLVAWEGECEKALESTRLTPGFYFGEMGLLTGEALGGDITALAQTVTYEIGKAALAPILKGRPAFADELGETLELLQEARRSVLEGHQSIPARATNIAERLSDAMRHLFSLGRA